MKQSRCIVTSSWSCPLCGLSHADGQTPPFSEATSKVGLIRQVSLHPAASGRRHVPCASGGRWTLTVVSLVPRAPAAGPTLQRVSHWTASLSLRFFHWGRGCPVSSTCPTHTHSALPRRPKELQDLYLWNQLGALCQVLTQVGLWRPRASPTPVFLDCPHSRGQLPSLELPHIDLEMSLCVSQDSLTRDP